jgi:hypothetical protein
VPSSHLLSAFAASLDLQAAAWGLWSAPATIDNFVPINYYNDFIILCSLWFMSYTSTYGLPYSSLILF